MKGFTEQHLKDYQARHADDPRIADALARDAPATPRKQGRKGQGYGKRAEIALSQSLALLGIPHETEYPWGKELNPPRRYRADAAIPARRLLVEVIGNAHAAGHAKLATDTERHQLATMHGLIILPVTPAQAIDGSAALLVEQFLSQKGGKHGSEG